MEEELMRRFLQMLPCLVLFLLINQAASGDDASWSIFRGNPALTGVAEGKLPDKPQLLWSVKIGDSVKSSPVIGNGAVFIGSDSNICALSLESGSNIWQVCIIDDTIEAPPLLDGNRIYVGTATKGRLYCFDAADGKSNWMYQTGGKIAGSANSFLSPDGKGRRILVGSYDNTLHCVDAADGKPIWTFKTSNFINGAPAVADGKVAFGGCDAMIHFVSVADGIELTNVVVYSPVAASPTLAGGYAYVGTYGNKVVCVSPTQTNTVWEYGRTNNGAAFFSSPAVYKDKVIIGGRDMNLHCINRKNGEMLWTFATRGTVDSCPVVCRKRVIVGSSDGRLYMVNLSDGSGVWSYEIGAPLTSSPAVAGGMIVIGSDDGKLYAFGKK
jgi:outer membrane protein assembly factor BamB